MSRLRDTLEDGEIWRTVRAFERADRDGDRDRLAEHYDDLAKLHGMERARAIWTAACDRYDTRNPAKGLAR